MSFVREALRDKPVALYMMDDTSPFQDYSGYNLSATAVGGWPATHPSLVRGATYSSVLNNDCHGQFTSPVFAKTRESDSFSLEAVVRYLEDGGRTYRENLALEPITQNLEVNPNPRWALSHNYWLGQWTASLQTSGGPTNGKYVRKTITATTNNSNGVFWVGMNPDIASFNPLTTPIPSVTPGDVITLSLFVRYSTAATTEIIAYRFYDSSGNPVTSTTVGPTNTITQNAWSRVSAAGITVPVGAAYCCFKTAANATAIGATFDAAGVMVEKSSTLKPYFDGSMTGYEWAGTANASISRSKSGLGKINYAAPFETGTTTEIFRNFHINPGAENVSAIGYQTMWVGSAPNAYSGAVITDSTDSVSGKSIRWTWTTRTSATGDIGVQLSGNSLVAGTTYTVKYKLKSINGGSTAAPTTYHGGTGTTTDLAKSRSSNKTFTAGEIETIWVQFTADATALANSACKVVTSLISTGLEAWEVFDVAITQGARIPDYFSGADKSGYFNDADFTNSWVGTANASASIITGTRINTTIDGLIPNWLNATAIRSTRWSKSGTYSVRVIPTGAGINDTAVYWAFPASYKGRTFTASATMWMPNAQTGSIDSRGRRLLCYGVSTYQSTQAANVAGESTHTMTFTLGGSVDQFRLYNGAWPAFGSGNDVWFDDLTVVDGNYKSEFFDGSTATASWLGTVSNSPSSIPESTIQVLGNTGLFDGLTIKGTVASFSTKYVTAAEAKASYDFQQHKTLHLVGIHTRDKNSLYVNGELVDETTLTTEQQADQFSSTSAYLYSGQAFLGDQLAINAIATYGKALDTEAIKRHYLSTRLLPDAEDIVSTYGGVRIPLTLDSANVFLDQWWDTSEHWNSGHLFNMSVVNDQLVPQFSGDVSLAGQWLGSFAIDSSGATSIYGVSVNWGGSGAVVEASLDGTTWETAVRGQRLSIVPSTYDPTGKVLQIRISFPGGITGDESFVDSLNVVGMSTGVSPAFYGRTVTLANGSAKRDYPPLEYHDNWGVKIETGGSIVISADTSVEAIPVRTVEVWIKPSQTDWLTFSLSAINTYRNGGYGSSYLPAGQWIVYHRTLAADLTGSLTIPMAGQIGQVVLYPTVLTNTQIAEIYSQYVGSAVQTFSDSSTWEVTETAPASKIYAYDWSISSSG